MSRKWSDVPSWLPSRSPRHVFSSLSLLFARCLTCSTALRLRLQDTQRPPVVRGGARLPGGSQAPAADRPPHPRGRAREVDYVRRVGGCTDEFRSRRSHGTERRRPEVRGSRVLLLRVSLSFIVSEFFCFFAYANDHMKSAGCSQYPGCSDEFWSLWSR